MLQLGVGHVCENVCGWIRSQMFGETEEQYNARQESKVQVIRKGGTNNLRVPVFEN